MLTTPVVLETTNQLIAYIHLTVPSAEIRTVMGPGLSELRAALDAQQIAPVGPWFTHHLQRPTTTFDFKICIPVNEEVAVTGRVNPGLLTASKVARAIYRGPFEGLAAAWGELDAWVVANGHKPRTDLWECYVAGPESSPDPASWQTELNRPLLD